MEITGSSSASGTPVVEAANTGFNGLTADDFMRMLITELQNQDPTEPLGNEQLLNQLSTMRNLSANIELADSLEAITSNQQLSTASTFIGKSVIGNTADNAEVSGVVDRAFLRDGKAFLTVNSHEVPLSNVSTVASA